MSSRNNILHVLIVLIFNIGILTLIFNSRILKYFSDFSIIYLHNKHLKTPKQLLFARTVGGTSLLKNCKRVFPKNFCRTAEGNNNSWLDIFPKNFSSCNKKMYISFNDFQPNISVNSVIMRISRKPTNATINYVWKILFCFVWGISLWRFVRAFCSSAIQVIYAVFRLAATLWMKIYWLI